MNGVSDGQLELVREYINKSLEEFHCTRKIDDVISTLKGIDCNFKGTSCPDQLARALEEIKEEL